MSGPTPQITLDYPESVGRTDQPHDFISLIPEHFLAVDIIRAAASMRCYTVGLIVLHGGADVLSRDGRFVLNCMWKEQADRQRGLVKYTPET